MRRVVLTFVLLFFLAMGAAAQDITEDLTGEQAEAIGAGSLVDELPDEAEEVLGDIDLTQGIDFWDKCKLLLYGALTESDSSLKEGMRLCAVLLGVATLCSIVQMSSVQGESSAVTIVGALGICAACVGTFQAMISLAADTVQQVADYTACFLPVIASASAMCGGMTSSGALYAGTVLFAEILMQLISKVLIPVVYFYLAIATAEAALSSSMLTELREFVGWLISKCLRIILYLFTGYMALTGVISGTTDAAAVKATKAAVSGMVPVVGGIMSDASETLLTSASLLKNSVGIFGMLAILAICLLPFLRVGIQYLMLKITAAVSGTVGLKPHIGLIKNFSSAMGYLLAMNGTCALMMLISSVCFLKVVG